MNAVSRNGPSFGFHGMFNLWRHLDDEALAEIAETVPVATVQGREYVECLIACCSQRRFTATQALYGRLRRELGAGRVGPHLAMFVTSPDAAHKLGAFCESLVTPGWAVPREPASVRWAGL